MNEAKNPARERELDKTTTLYNAATDYAAYVNSEKHDFDEGMKLSDALKAAAVSYAEIAGDRQPVMSKTGEPSTLASATGYAHPTTIQEFEAVYRKEYEQELEGCNRWIKWCEKQNDTHGMNFHQGMRAAHVFNNIKTEQLLRVLKQEAPNARRGHNDRA